MAMGYSYFPTGHLKFNEWFIGLGTWITTNYTGAGSPVWQSEFGELANAYSDAYNAWLNKPTRDKVKVEALKFAEAALLRFLRATVVPYMIADTVNVSDDTLAALGIRPRSYSHHSPIPAPQISPAINVLTGQNHDAKVVVFEPLDGGAIKYLVSSKGIKGCRVDWRLATTPESAEVAESIWESTYLTRMKHQFVFPSEMAGKRIEFRAAFTNPRLEIGPWSDVVSAIIT